MRGSAITLLATLVLFGCSASGGSGDVGSASPVPDVVGQSMAEATRTLIDAGYTWRYETEETLRTAPVEEPPKGVHISPSEAADVVTAQVPTGGSESAQKVVVLATRCTDAAQKGTPCY